jgi:hypothetical protein
MTTTERGEERPAAEREKGSEEQQHVNTNEAAADGEKKPVETENVDANEVIAVGEDESEAKTEANGELKAIAGQQDDKEEEVKPETTTTPDSAPEKPIEETTAQQPTPTECATTQPSSEPEKEREVKKDVSEATKPIPAVIEDPVPCCLPVDPSMAREPQTLSVLRGANEKLVSLHTVGAHVWIVAHQEGSATALSLTSSSASTATTPSLPWRVLVFDVNSLTCQPAKFVINSSSRILIETTQGFRSNSSSTSTTATTTTPTSLLIWVVSDAGLSVYDDASGLPITCFSTLPFQQLRAFLVEEEESGFRLWLASQDVAVGVTCYFVPRRLLQGLLRKAVVERASVPKDLFTTSHVLGMNFSLLIFICFACLLMFYMFFYMFFIWFFFLRLFVCLFLSFFLCLFVS